MGFIGRLFSMLFLITFPVKLIIWFLIVMFLFSMVAIKGLITNSGYYNSVRLQNYIETKNDEFLTGICKESGTTDCMMISTVFSKDDSTMIHSYSKYTPLIGGGLKSVSHASTINIDKNIWKNTNLAVLKTLRTGCVELERTTTDLIKFYGLDTPSSFTHSYICFKRNTYFTLFTKGRHCETCGVKLNEYFTNSSSTIYYGYENGFFDRASRYFYDGLSNFFSTRSNRINRFFTKSVKNSAKAILGKVAGEEDPKYKAPSDLTEEKPAPEERVNYDTGEIFNEEDVSASIKQANEQPALAKKSTKPSNIASAVPTLMSSQNQGLKNAQISQEIDEVVMPSDY